MKINWWRKPWNCTGLIAVCFKWRYLAVHVLPRTCDWGYSSEWYDGRWSQFGVGPFLLICWADCNQVE